MDEFSREHHGNATALHYHGLLPFWPMSFPQMSHALAAMSFPQILSIAAASTFLTVVISAGCRPSKYPGVRGPRPAFLLGSLVEFLLQGPLKCFIAWSRQYGDVFKFQVGLKEWLVVADPDLVKEVLVKKFKAFRNRPCPDELQSVVLSGIVLGRDKAWSISRGATMPWFHNKEHLESYVSMMTQHLDRLSAELSSLPERHVLDIYGPLQTLTLDVFCTAAFGATLDDSTDAQASAVSKLVSKAARSISIPTPSSLMALFLPTPLAKLLNRALSLLPGTQEHRRKASFDRRTQLGAQLIRARQRDEQQGARKTDVLTQLLRSQAKAEKEQVRLSPSALMYILGELIVAGSDTTSNTITFALFLLCTNPGPRTKLVEEVDSLWGQYPPTNVDNLEKYQYVSMVVKEVLRLFPPGAQLVREAQEDTSVGDVRVPKGAQLMFHLWLLHRNPKHFLDPDSFVPERFDPEDPEAAKNNNMGAYMPFGSGPRMCLGAKFALQEAMMALITLYRMFSFKVAGPLGELQGEAAMAQFPVDTGIIMKPADGLKVLVVKRM